MPCVEPRKGKVGPPTVSVPVGILLPLLRLAALGLESISHSPGVSIEELRDAIIRIWRDEEKGYFAEARFTPRSAPIYTMLTTEQAQNLMGPEPDPSLIAMAFERIEPVME